jgi:hypothetical protein
MQTCHEPELIKFGLKAAPTTRHLPRSGLVQRGLCSTNRFLRRTKPNYPADGIPVSEVILPAAAFAAIYRVGDNYFTSPDRHETKKERLHAFSSGFEGDWTSSAKGYDAGLDYVRKVESMDWSRPMNDRKDVEPVRPRAMRLEEPKLQLLHALHDDRDITTVGKDLWVAAHVNNVLHFRIFDEAGKKIVDTDQEHVERRTRAPLRRLRDELTNLWPPHENTEADYFKILWQLRVIFAKFLPPVA